MSTSTLKFQHASLQFSDNPKQQAADAEKVFASGFHVLTGTEAGKDNPNYRLVAEAAERHGYKITNKHSNWVAIDKDIIKYKSWEAGEVFIADNDESVGAGHDTTLPWVSFDHVDEGMGHITVAVVHYPTQGRTKNDPNFDINERAARAIGDLAQEKGKGSALFFLAGDFNMTFNKGPDPLFGEAMKSTWNELARFENTGHGTIDAILSYDHDGRVKAKWVKALDDSEFFLNTDHFLVQAAFTIEHLKAADK